MRKVQPDDFQAVIQAQERKLHEGKIKRFAEEPLVTTLLERMEKPPNADALYEVFEKAKDLDEFLNCAGMTGEKFDVFLKMWRSEAERDFNNFRRKYVDEKDEGIAMPTRASRIRRVPR
jgi:hypothetical protein